MSDEESVPQAELDAWVHDIEAMYYGGLWDPGYAVAAEDAAARLISEYDIVNAPPDMLEALRHAIEVGYMTALQQVREGAFDAQIRTWRPDMASG